MKRFAYRLLAVTALGFTLSACVTDPALMGTTGATSNAGANLPAQPKLIEGVYAAKADPQFNVPAVPVEKVPVEFQRQTVAYETDQPPGTIIINPGAKHLYLVTGKNKALRYGIAVGKAGFQWSGEALITERKLWPTWRPPEEMIARKPELEKWKDGQPGGLDNPLGARALYLTTNGVDYGYRIHGTPEWSSIGKNASSGCIRMINQDVMDLFERVPDGTKVIVLNADGSMPKGLTLPPPQPKKAKPAAPKAVQPTTVAAQPGVQPVGTVAPAVTPAPGTPVLPAVTTTTPGTTTTTVVPAKPVVPAATVVTPAPATAAVTPTPTTTVVTPAPAVTAPAATATTTTTTTTTTVQPVAPATTTVQPTATCTVPLVNGVCPAN